MLKNSNPFRYSINLSDELLTARQEGKDTSAYEERVKSILEMEDSNPQKDVFAAEIYDEIQALPIIEGHPYTEPSDIEEIRAARPKTNHSLLGKNLDEKDLYDKIYGAWLGRCVGCLLGKPIEGWDRQRITGFLKETGNYPVQYYLSSDVAPELKEKYQIVKHAWINNVECAPMDDDTNYTVLALKVFETYGIDFTPENVATAWLRFLPILSTCTAERVAYRNFVYGIVPPHSGSYRNPYRELIGAQIRADFFGYVTPGNPELAAEYAWRDACISHVKNGIYGEMFIAAMLSAAAVTEDMEEIIMAGLAQIPEKSRLTEQIRNVLEWKAEGLNWEQAIDRIHTLFNEKNFDWVHTISNAVIVCTALLFGEKDLEKSIGIAITSAFDTDCNGATVGSVVGMLLGAKALPEKWIKPLNDRLLSSISDYGSTPISELAAKTMKIMSQVCEGRDNIAEVKKDKKISSYVQNVE